MRRHHGPVAVRETAGNLRLTDHDGLLWTLRPIDPSWPRYLRALIADIRSHDRRYADWVLECLPPTWRTGHDLGWDLA